MSLKELNSIEVGDYIVHVDHGVGRFGGLLRTNVNGHTQEMIKLTYLNDDIIFVSIHALHKLAKYRGKEGVPPKINKLGSGAWNRVKEHTKAKLKDIARDLIRLYAARREEKGFSFSPDSYMQHELEASFIYDYLVCPHKDIDLAFGQVGQYLLCLLGRAGSRQVVDPHGEILEALGESDEMLVGQHGGGHQYCGLLAVCRRLECGAYGYFGLSEPNIAAYEPVHRPFAFHVPSRQRRYWPTWPKARSISLWGHTR